MWRVFCTWLQVRNGPCQAPLCWVAVVVAYPEANGWQVQVVDHASMAQQAVKNQASVETFIRHLEIELHPPGTLPERVLIRLLPSTHTSGQARGCGGRWRPHQMQIWQPIT